MSIQEHLNKIRNAVYGHEVRESIAKGIETAYDDASENGNANMEVKIARGTHPNLRSRLDETTAQLQQTDEEIIKLKKNIIFVRSSTELKSALENVKTGQTILLQESKYVIDMNIVMNAKNHVVITGLGRTEIEFIGTGDFITLNDCFGIEFHKIQLFHSTGTNAGSGLVLNRCQRINFFKVTIYNFQYDLLKTTESWWLRTDDCIFDKGLTDTHAGVSHGKNSNNVVHYHSRFVTRGSGPTIDILGGYGITIDNCDISGAGKNIGIKRNASTSVNITNSYFEGNLVSIQLGSTGYLETGLIQGNYFNIQGGNNDKIGIDIILGSNIKIASNMFLGNNPTKTSIGVRVADTPNNKNIVVDSDNTFSEVTTRVANPNNRVSYNQRKRIYATQPPTVDLWIVGDRVINSDTKVLTDAGTQYFISEWVCVGSGTPGTWKDVRVTI